MDIKLRARLSAYSKIESINGINSNVPDPDATKEGHILGVGSNGQYTLFGKVTQEDIDTKFESVGDNDVATKEEIDDLFPKKDDVDAVTKEEIDSLFGSTQKTESATKEEIDDLFTTNDEPKVGTVSYADIDSLFN